MSNTPDLNNIKVTFFVTQLDSGGIENYLLRFLKKYPTIDATVICKSGKKGEDLVADFSGLGVKIVPFRLGYINLGAYIQLQKFLKSKQIDTVCDFTGNFAGLTLLSAKHAGVKRRIAFYRGSTNRFQEGFIRNSYNKLVNKLVWKNATAILSNSQAAFDFFFKKEDSRFMVIQNGVDKQNLQPVVGKVEMRQKIGVPNDAFVICHSGRVHYSKNHKAILEAANMLCEKYKDIHFVLAGKGTEELLNETINTNITSNLHLLGYRDDIPEILNMSDLFVFPSVTEGQPNALIEAMVCGLPFIASNIDPVKETVPETFQNKLVDPLYSKTLAEKIENLYLNRDLLKEYSCKEWAAQKYDAAVQFEKFHNQLTHTL